MSEEIRKLVTERPNPKSETLDLLPAFEILRLMNEEDFQPPSAITPLLPMLARFVEEGAKRLRDGGRLFYVGAGTSGRLGVLDASECPPTFGTAPIMVQGIIAGGAKAIFKAVEGAEDKAGEGKRILEKKKLTSKDCVVGLSASGRTPFVVGALKCARKKKALTSFVTCNAGARMLGYCDFGFVLEVGPEVVSGSTRLKCGTAQKMILNMISTAIMVKLGRVSGNRMVDLVPKSKKLWERAKGLVMEEARVSEKKAESLLQQAHGSPRKAIEMYRNI